MPLLANIVFYICEFGMYFGALSKINKLIVAFGNTSQLLNSKALRRRTWGTEELKNARQSPSEITNETNEKQTNKTN